MSELYKKCVQFLTKFWEGNPFSTFDLSIDYDDDDGADADDDDDDEDGVRCVCKKGLVTWEAD